MHDRVTFSVLNFHNVGILTKWWPIFGNLAANGFASFYPRRKNQSSKNERDQKCQHFWFLYLPSIRLKQHLGPGFYTSGKHDFSKPSANSEKAIVPTQRELSLTEVSHIFEAPEQAKHQSIGDPQKMPTSWQLHVYGQNGSASIWGRFC